MERRTLPGLIIMGLSAFAVSTAWANSPPVVSSVRAAQRSDKLVEIRFDLTDAEGDGCVVSVQASDDAGVTWALPVTAVSGDVGPGVVPGASKLIVWDSKVDLPGAYGTKFKVRICADDGHNLPPNVSNPYVKGILMQGEQGTAQFFCTAGDLDGTVQAVTVDLTAIGGSVAQPLAKGNGSQWQGALAVIPGSKGLKSVTFTAVDNRGAEASAQAAIMVAPTGMVYIPAGEYQMGDSFVSEGDLDERPAHAVQVNGFFMDYHEVTNQQYAAALSWAASRGGVIVVANGVVYPAGDTAHPLCDTYPTNNYSQVTWDGRAFGIVAGKENYPVMLVSWYGAAAYANWRSQMQGLPPVYDLSTWACNWGGGYRLPAEAEWERAARGGASGHRFPWVDGDMINHTRANYYSVMAQTYDLGPKGYDPIFAAVPLMPYTSPVGHYAANGFGLYDISGNVWEWCNDWYEASYYSQSPHDNPHGPADGSTRILRGGAWGSAALSLRCAYRSDALPGYRAITNGFRLVLSGQ
jgi:formylglycine-generating enzyme required for sulfatase activity